jgi:thiol-disulfide isomerase/thioredoxin
LLTSLEGRRVKKLLGTVLLVVVALVGVAAQTPAIIVEVRGAIKANDFAAGDKLLSAYRGANGVTPDYLEALSWMGRGTLAVKNLDAAERYARDTYALSVDMLKKRPLDQEPRLPIALGAAIEVLAQVDAARGARSEAVLFLQKEVAAYKGTSIEKRIHKNINLISLEGQPAPAIDLSEHLGPKPPTLASLKGKVVLLFFWAHWCGDCKQQAPILADLVKKYSDQGLVLVAPTMRFGYVARGKDAPPDEEMRYIDQVRQEFYPVLAGQPIPVSEATHMRFGVSTTPTLVLVDRRGIIRMYNPGRLTMEQLEPRVRALLTAS